MTNKDQVAEAFYFLIARLDDFVRSGDGMTDEGVRDWDGHVGPALARAKSTLTAPVPESPRAETGWLIERQDIGSSAKWLMCKADADKWTADASEALRFARRIDAEVYCSAYGLDDPGFTVFITEHMWMETNQKKHQPPSPEESGHE